jgi:hypothetical protein
MSTRLTPKPAATRYPAVEGCALRIYTEHQGMLSRAAWEALGSPPAIAIEYDDRGYSIVATTLGDAAAIRVYRNRQVSIGVLAAALRGSAFPLRISLEPEYDMESCRLRFGTVA